MRPRLPGVGWISSVRRSAAPPPARAVPGPAAPPPRPTLSGPQPLADVLAGLLRAVVEGRQAMDGASAELAKAYWADPILRTLPLPTFTIPEVTVRLRFAMAAPQLRPPSKPDAAALAGISVIVDFAVLEKLPANLISEIELRVTPQMLRAFAQDTEGAGAARS